MKIKAQFPWCFQIQVLHLRYSEDENSAYEAKSILRTSFCVETILKVHLLLRHIFKFRANSKKSEYFENCRRHENRQKAFQKCMAFKFSGMRMQFGNTVTESRHLHFVKILFLRSKVRILLFQILLTQFSSFTQLFRSQKNDLHIVQNCYKIRNLANRETKEDTDLLFMWSELSGLAPNQFPLVMANSDLKMFDCLSGNYKSIVYYDLGVAIICFHGDGGLP